MLTASMKFNSCGAVRILNRDIKPVVGVRNWNGDEVQDVNIKNGLERSNLTLSKAMVCTAGE
jgi:hypothetical protein